MISIMTDIKSNISLIVMVPANVGYDLPYFSFSILSEIFHNNPKYIHCHYINNHLSLQNNPKYIHCHYINNHLSLQNNPKYIHYHYINNHLSSQTHLQGTICLIRYILEFFKFFNQLSNLIERTTYIQFFRDADCLIMVYDITSRETFQALEMYWYVNALLHLY